MSVNSEGISFNHFNGIVSDTERKEVKRSEIMLIHSNKEVLRLHIKHKFLSMKNRL